MTYGEIRDVPADLAKDLIKAGHAEAVEEIKEEKKNDKDNSKAPVRKRKRG